MELGRVFHKAFELFYDKDFNDDEVELYITSRFDEMVANADPYKAEDYEINKHIALGMWCNYPRKWRDEFEEITSEMEFKIPLIDGVDFVGRIDGLVKLDGAWWIRELKTSTISVSQFDRRAKISSQVTGYVYALRQMGVDVKGIIYDFIRKPLIRKRSSDTAQTYGQRLFSEYITRPDYYYHRHKTYRTPNELNLYEQDMKLLAEEIKQKCEDKKFYRNTSNCFNYNSECPYKKICFDEKPDELTLQLYFKERDKHETKAKRT
jgi:hypothetical protein